MRARAAVTDSGGVLAGRADSGARQGAFGGCWRMNEAGSSFLLGGHHLAGVVEEMLECVVGVLGAGEAVAVGAFELAFGHPGGVVAVAVGGDGGLLVLVPGGGAVDEVGGRGAGRDIGDQDAGGAVGEGEVGQVGLEVVADPLGVLLDVHFVGVDAESWQRAHRGNRR
ncbi:hypothetical protein SHIRM173S_09239 [Streptomyces hirsutus]